MPSYPCQTKNTSGWGYATINKTCKVSASVKEKAEETIGAFDRLENWRAAKFPTGIHWKVWQVSVRTATEIEREFDHSNNGWAEEICGLATIISWHEPARAHFQDKPPRQREVQYGSGSRVIRIGEVMVQEKGGLNKREKERERERDLKKQLGENNQKESYVKLAEIPRTIFSSKKFRKTNFTQK